MATFSGIIAGTIHVTHPTAKYPMESALEFEWDEEKRLSNLRKHGIDFEDATEIFDGRFTVTFESHYQTEERQRTVGVIRGDVITIVWTQRGPAIRVISARRARKNEIALLERAQSHSRGTKK